VQIVIRDKNDAYGPESNLATPKNTGSPQKGLPGLFPGAAERIAIKHSIGSRPCCGSPRRSEVEKAMRDGCNVPERVLEEFLDLKDGN